MKKIISFACVFAAALVFGCTALAQKAPAYWCASSVEAYGTEISIEDYCKAASCTADELFSLAVSADGDAKAVMNGSAYSVTAAKGKNAGYLLSDGNDQYPIEPCEGDQLRVILNEDIMIVLSPADEMPGALQADALATSIEAEENSRRMLAEMMLAREAAEKEAFRQSVVLPPIEFTADETAAMSNFMLHGRYYFDGDTIFGMAIEANNAYPDLIRAGIFYDVETPKIGTIDLIDAHVNADYLTPHGNDLYYVCHDRDAGRAYLARLNMTTLATEKLTAPAANAGFMQIREDRIYFTDEDYHLCTCDLNGKNRKKILEKPVYTPYFIADDWLIYQNGEDDLALHVTRLSDGMDLALTDVPACNPIISGHELFFLAQEGGSLKGRLGRIDLSAPNHGGDLAYEITLSPERIGEEFSIFNGVIYGCNGTSVAVANWQKLSNTAWNGVTERLYYMNSTYTVTASAVRDDAGEKDLITTIYLGDQYGHSSAFKRIH